MFLYRGVSKAFHEKTGGLIKPKKMGPFEYKFKWDEPGHRWDSGTTWVSSPDDAVIRHQLNQEGFPTSGLSTTPHLERAIVYARGMEGSADGFIYKMDSTQLKQYSVDMYVVSAYARRPSIPEDDEVILVTPDGGPLPKALVEMIPLSEVLKTA